MPNPIFGGLFSNPQPVNNQNQMPSLNDFLANPAKYQGALEEFKMGLQGDPQQMAMQQIQSGQIPQNKVNMALGLAGMIRRMLPK